MQRNAALYSDLNVEEEKEYTMTRGFLPQNRSGGGLLHVIGNTRRG